MDVIGPRVEHIDVSLNSHVVKDPPKFFFYTHKIVLPHTRFQSWP